MKKRILSMLLSLAVLVSMCIPCTAFAESEGATNISITVCEPDVGQPYHEGYTIDGIDYSMSLTTSAMSETLGHFNYKRKYEGGWGAMSEGALFDYDSTYTIEACIMCPSMDKPFTGSYTATVNGRSAKVEVQPDQLSMYITCEFKTGSREPIKEIWLDGYKPVKAGTTPATITMDADHKGEYTVSSYYSRPGYYDYDTANFNVGTKYELRIFVEAPYNYTFEGITLEDIHIKGYDKTLEDIYLNVGDGNFAHGTFEATSSYLNFVLPAEAAVMNEYNFTVPEPKEGVLPGQATLEANDDISYEGIDWYKSKYEWSEAVKMKEGEKFEAGYDYYAQPKYSWNGEELAPGSYTIKVNGDTYNGEYFSFSHLYREIDLKITVAEPKVGNTPAQTFSANSADIPISNQVCWWYFLPNAPSTDGAQLMESTDKFALGCCYAFVPSFNYDLDIYDINRIYVNGVEMSEGFMMFGPLAKQTQAIKNVNAAYSKVYGSAFTLKPTSATSRTYKSSNTKIATVSSAGKVTIKGIGTAKITITAAEDATYSKASKTVEIKAVPKTAAVSKSTPGKRKLTVKMGTKVTATGGATYQIAYKQKGTSKWKYTTTTKQSKVISKLKKGKRYYVKVRAYKTVSKTKYYGAWSKTKLSSRIK